MFNHNYFLKQNQGYTIIETMVSLAIFMIIILAGTSALLNSNAVYHKSQDMRSILDNLTFIMEDMSRNIRTGYNYRCVNDGNYTSNKSTPKSCSTGGGFIFETDVGDPDSDNDQWIYKIQSTDGSQTFNLSKSSDGGNNYVQLNLNEVNIDATSGFSVLGAEPPTDDSQQPLVIIRLSGKILYKDIATPFSLQTSVSQRLIDI